MISRPHHTILAGAGPLAGTLLLNSLLADLADHAHLTDDDDFPICHVSTAPIPGMDQQGVAQPAVARAHLAQCAQQAADQGHRALWVMCMSLHACFPSDPPLPVVSFLDAALQELRRQPPQRLAVWEADRGHPQGGLVARALGSDYEIIALTPDEQRRKDDLIRRRMQGASATRVQVLVDGIVRSISQRAGPVTMLWACSELHGLSTTYPHQDIFTLAMPALRPAWGL